MPDKRKSKMVEFSSETVIFDEKGNRVIACPTEQEAVEYVREQEQEADREGCEYHECNKPGRKPRFCTLPSAEDIAESSIAPST